MKMCRLLVVPFLFVMCLDGTFSFINLANTECGVDLSRRGRIVGGTDSLPAEFPWTASVWRQGAHQCGATVLTDRWLVTAGHCVCSVFNEFFKAKQLSVVVGTTDITAKEENEPISLIIPHPDYRCAKKTNDVALLKTVRPLKWSRSLKPACLPQSAASDYSGSLATVAGWGFTHEDRGKGSRPNILQKTDVVVVTNEECNTWYKSQGTKVKVIQTQMCAGHEDGGRDSCWADSGGPLMVHKEGRMLLIGVVSTGSGCARARQPGIYTRMSQYTDWISDSIRGDESRAGVRWWPRSG